MAKVIVALSKSLDGFIAGPNDGNELPLGAGEPRSSTVLHRRHSQPPR